MFTWLDLIAPIGIGVVATVLCTWGALKAATSQAKIVCIITGSVFLSSIPIVYAIRYSGLIPDYRTTYGIQVKQGDKNRCVKEDIDKWSSWTVNFWSKQEACKDAEVDSLQGLLVVCRDEEKLSVLGRYVRGYQQYNVIVVGYNGKLAYTESLYKHELSHYIVYKCGVEWNEQVHHDLFKQVKLGY